MKYVIKIGGSVLDNGMPESLMDDFSMLRSGQVTIVHGGGKTVTRISKKMGIEPKFIVSASGIKSRFTDEETIDVYKMVMTGKLNSDIVLALHRRHIRAFGFSGLDGPTIFGQRKRKLIVLDGRDRKMAVDGGLTGRITRVDTSIISFLLESHIVPVISPIAISEESEPLNVDADRAASSIASTIGAEKLIMITDVEGVLHDGEILEKVTVEELEEINGEVGNGMDKKLIFVREALSHGVKEVIIASGFGKDPLQNALYGKRRTVIVT